jgi:hypothetical protein
MTDHERAEQLVVNLHRLDATIVQLSQVVHETVGDIEGLNRASFADGGVRGAERLGGAISVEGLFGLVRGRLRSVGLEALLQRHVGVADAGWVESTATRLRRLVR